MAAGKPQRSAAEGAFIDQKEIAGFLAHCAAGGLQTREHSGWPVQSGYQVRYQGHWMALCWNKHWKRYTADKRLGELVDQFVARQPRSPAAPGPRPTR